MALGNFSALRSAFSNRNFAIYMSGNILSLVGYWMQRLAVGWLAWETSHSEFWVGAVAFAEICPLIVVGPLFGVWADRFDRKLLAIVIQCLSSVQALALFLVIKFDMLSIGLLVGLTLIEGMIQASYQPVRLALIPNLVEKKDLVAAAAFTAVSFNVARFAGPAIGGIVINLYSPAWAVLFNSISYLLIVSAWYFIRLPAFVPKVEKKKSILGDMKEGALYVLDRPALLSMFMLLTIIALFARPLSYLLSAFVGAVYNAGPETLALFTSSVGAGAVLAGLKITMSGQTRGLIREIMLTTLITIVSLIWFASTQNKWLATGLIFCFGYSITICTVASQTLVQTAIDDVMRGRVLSLWVAFTRGAPALGVLVIGWFANIYGLMWPNVIAGLLCLCGLLLMVRRRRDMRKYFEHAES
ncbi:MAG: MFS transporter [Pseudomonadota bacterium]